MVYALLYMKISTPSQLAAYREKAADALKKHGGHVLHATPESLVLEGPLSEPDLAGILAFPSKEAALAWHNDPALASLHALRRSAGESTIILL